MGEHIGCSRGGRSSKVHAAVNAQGLPLRVTITGGQVHDSKAAEDFLDWPDDPLAIVADKAYSSNRIKQAIEDQAALAVIPTESNARKPIAHDKALYAMREKVEYFFCKLKDVRRLATRFEKRARNFLAMVHLFCIRMYIN